MDALQLFLMLVSCFVHLRGIMIILTVELY